MRKLIISTLLILLGLAAGASGFMASVPRPVVVEPLDTGGHEAPVEGSLYDNGWNVMNHGESGLKDTYLRLRHWLGEPISSFDGQCQSFRFGRLCYDPGKPEDWRIELSNSGWEDMLVEGYSPKPGSTPHPAVRDWKLSQLENGADLTRLVGRTISDPICDQKSHQCRQWTDKQLFLFEENAISDDRVQRAPLGLWLVYPQARAAATLPSEIVPSPPPVPSLAIAGMLVVAGVGLMLIRGGARGSASI